MVKVILGSALGGLVAGAIALFAAGQARSAAAPFAPATYAAPLPAMAQPTTPTVACGPNQEPAMLGSQNFDEIAARISKAIENSPAKDIEKNVKAMLSSGLARLDVVPRAEFDVQTEVLRKTREKLEALEKRVAEFEARFPPPAAP